MPPFSTSSIVLTLAILLLLARPTHAFGAGNIASVSKVEGLNWRHGDIEDTLLTLMMSRAAGGKKFDKMNVARVYFGNWLRDYSQAIDVGTVKYVSAEAIRILLWVLGFMTFGYGTKEFEVTADRLGCYRPEDHIDNPKDYADNIDATQYDPRLRGPVNERVELAIDPRTGLKNYIANEQAGCMTSALHVRRLFTRCIELGRSYGRSRNKDELYESLRLLGTGLHCLEDYSAHSNYTELALIEMGERDIFPHVGRATSIRLQGAQHPVYPIVTGTFGGVDFLHSVMGEFDDKATQSELQELEGSLKQGNRADNSMLKELLSSIPSGIFGGQDQAGKADELQANATAAQMSQMRVSPRQPEAWTLQMQESSKSIYPIIQWHDEIMQGITETIENIPILPDLIENIEEQVNVFVFSLLAPFVVPIIEQIKTELNEGSSEIIQSSQEKQLVVFHHDQSSDPTHSMLSKDHFSNILNEPAGKIASSILKWVVPQITLAIDDPSIDPSRTINRIIHGVFHHPAQRHFGDDGAAEGRAVIFNVVENWWGEKSEGQKRELRSQLSREGVMNGANHKEGVVDTGHGCGKPLSMAKSSGQSGPGVGGLMGNILGGAGGNGRDDGITKFAEEAAGGGVFGTLLGGLAGAVGGGLLSGAFTDDEPQQQPQTNTYSSQGYTAQGGYRQNVTQIGHEGNQYAQAQYSTTQFPSGRQETEFQRFEQNESGAGRFQDVRTGYGAGGREETHRYAQETESWKQHRKSESEGSDDSERKRERRHHKKKHSGEDFGHGGRERFEEPPRQEYGGRSGYEPPPPRQEFGGYGGGRGGFEEPPRQEFGGRGEYGGGYEQPPPPRQEFGGYGGRGEFEQPPPRQEYGRGFEEPPRQEYGGRGEYGGGYQEERRERFEEQPRREYGGGFEGNEGGWGEREREQEQEEEYREERREERRW